MNGRAEGARCPACGAADMRVFHEERSVPAHSCILLGSEDEARAFPRGDIRLGHCERCGFISNTAYDPRLAQYSARYEETQGFSPRFREFASGLAHDWVERHGLNGRSVLEIGCGKGEFLALMLEAGAARGTGIDPAVAPARIAIPPHASVEWIPELFDERYLHLGAADAVVCRHTLEHIHPVADFVRLVRRAVEARLDTDTVVLFELPDTLRVLREVAFWDVYYEHCSYFTPGSLVRLFRACGFEVLDVSLAYDDQYILLEARSAASGGPPPAHMLPLEDDLDATREAVAHFEREYARKVAAWRADIERVRAGGGRAVIWGAGSKGVAYLNTLGIAREIEFAVDINPHKHGTYMGGTGQRIVPPEFLREYRPSVVIAMNPVYREEIRRDLVALGVDAELVAV